MKDLKALLIVLAIGLAVMCFFYGSRFAIRAVTDVFWPGFTIQERDYRADP